MKKKLMIALALALVTSLCFGSVALAALPVGTVNINMSGSNYSFGVNTWLPDGTDSFTGNSSGSLLMNQTVRYVTSSQYASDAYDIDRSATFAGNGEIMATTWYDSSAQWSWAESTMGAFVESDTSGFFGQNLHLDSNFGGVKDVDQWKKQRTMSILASGDYEMGFSGWDTRSSVTPAFGSTLSNYGFEFYASNSAGSGNLFVDDFYTNTEHGAGQYYNPDSLTVLFDYVWTGNGSADIQGYAVRGGSTVTNIDLINKWLYGNFNGY